MESASRKTAEVAAKAAPEPADRAPCKPADTGSPEPADMATPEPAYRAPSKSADRGSPEPADRTASKTADMASPKSAARSGDKITPNPTYVTATAAKAPSEPSTRAAATSAAAPDKAAATAKNCGCVQYRTQQASSLHQIVRWRSRLNWRAAECGRSDCRLESADPNQGSGSLRAWVRAGPSQPPRQL